MFSKKDAVKNQKSMFTKSNILPCTNTKGKIMNTKDSIISLIGKTPLYIPKSFIKEQNINAQLMAKLEFMNPAGSAKDRAALYMVNSAIERGELKEGGTVIEPTSGNTGIALSALAAAKGFKAVIVMPDSMSLERQKLMKAYGATLVLTPGKDGMKGAIAKAKEIKDGTSGAIIAGQFENPSNPLAHYETTAREIWADADGEIDVFLACVGTGGTFSGCAKYFKEKNPDIITVAVEPESSALISKGQVGAHKIQGIGANFIPENFDSSLCDKVITVSDSEAYKAGREFSRSEGLLVGISSGAALAGAIKLSKCSEFAGKKIALVLPDGGERYLSTPDYLD